LLQDTADYAATNGTSVVLTTGALVGDSLTIISFATFDVANTYTQAQADALFIADTIVDAKGDIIAATAADTVSRLAVGANDTVLTADSSTATGLKWATPGAAATSYALINTGGTALTGASTITVSGLSGYNKLMVLITDASSASGDSDFSWRINADTGATAYQYATGPSLTFNSTYASGNFGAGFSQGDQIYFAKMSGSTSSTVSGGLLIDGSNSSGIKILQSLASGSAAGNNGHQAQIISGVYTGTSVVSSVSVLSTAGNFDNGTLFIYGA
jgi:hypothetical protein